MGASIGMAHGFEKARGRNFSKKMVGVIGDSTFIHSGIGGLIDVVYNKGISTILILDNSITAMTGHQDNPATGLTIKGEIAPALDLVALVKAIGIGTRKQVLKHNKLRILSIVMPWPNAIRIVAQEPTAISVYGINGVLLASQTTSVGQTDIELPKGVYIVRSNGGTQKVVVR